MKKPFFKTGVPVHIYKNKEALKHESNDNNWSLHRLLLSFIHLFTIRDWHPEKNPSSSSGSGFDKMSGSGFNEWGKVVTRSPLALLPPEGVELLVRLAARAHRPENSVADPGCLSRIPDTDFYPSRFPDPKTATKKRGVKKNCCHSFTFSHKFHKI